MMGLSFVRAHCSTNCEENTGGLHSTGEAFLFPTQQPRVQITAPTIFFLFYCLVGGQY